MLHELLTWVQIAAASLCGYAISRKRRETGDSGYLWLGLGFCGSTVIVIMAQAWCTLVFWPHSPHQERNNEIFSTLLTCVQMLSLAVGIYMIGGTKRLRNFLEWITSEDGHLDSATALRSK
jgi:hypothetical protein